MPSSNICPKCGRDNRAGSISCSSCYASLAQAPGHVAVANARAASGVQPCPPTVVNKQIPKTALVKRFPIWRRIEAIIVLAIAFAIIAWLLFPRPLPLDPTPPDQVVRNLIVAIKSNDVAKVRESFCFRDRRNFFILRNGEMAVAESLTLQFPDSNDGTSLGTNVGTPIYNGDIAYVPVLSEDSVRQASINEKPPPKPIEIVFVKEDGEWKISFKETTKNMYKDSPGTRTLLNLMP